MLHRSDSTRRVTDTTPQTVDPNLAMDDPELDELEQALQDSSNATRQRVRRSVKRGGRLVEYAARQRSTLAENKEEDDDDDDDDGADDEEDADVLDALTAPVTVRQRAPLHKSESTRRVLSSTTEDADATTADVDVDEHPDATVKSRVRRSVKHGGRLVAPAASESKNTETAQTPVQNRKADREQSKNNDNNRSTNAPRTPSAQTQTSRQTPRHRAADSSATPSRPCWREAVDEASDKVFYWNTLTNAVRWDPPDEPVIPLSRLTPHDLAQATPKINAPRRT